jgi:hypothetical protein
MPLHILKLCVGADSIRDLEEWIAERLSQKRAAGQPAEHTPRTRMIPRRKDELLDGGSIYWVIKGQIAARQRLLDIRPYTDEAGVGQCHLVCDPVVVPVSPRRHRAFQGWRYLSDHEAPPDLGREAIDASHMPEKLQQELRELGLL